MHIDLKTQKKFNLSQAVLEKYLLPSPLWKYQASGKRNHWTKGAFLLNPLYFASIIAETEAREKLTPTSDDI